MSQEKQGGAAAPQPQGQPQRSPVSLRAVIVGLAGVVFICALTPFNDYALNNTFLIGNNLPLGLMLLAFLFVVLINSPLSRWMPRYALTSGEMVVAFSMILVACALPSSGLMRYLPGSIISPIYQAQTNFTTRALLEQMDLPQWMFPRLEGETIEEKMLDPVVTGYFSRWIEEAPLPFRAWLVPAAAWGIFVGSLFGSLLCMVLLVRRQWFENERLPFPLAQIQLAVLEAPRPGRLLNSTLAQPIFWVAFAAVLFVRSWNGLGEYFPQYFPLIPMGYDMTALMTERPLSFTTPHFRVATIFLIAVGMTYFLSTQVAFSLWFFFVADQVYRMILGSTAGDPSRPGAWDEHFGAVIAFGLAILWIGRRHWQLVIAQAFRGRQAGEPQGEYISYPVAFWALLTFMSVMCVWLINAGMSIIPAIVVVIMVLMLFLIITRIIAETGLVYGQLVVPIYRPWQLLAIYGFEKPVTLQTFYMSGMVQHNFYDFREPLPVYASHAIKLSDQTAFSPADDEARRRRTGRRIIAVLVLALLVAYPVSFASTLWTNYSYATTQDLTQQTPINPWGNLWATGMYLLRPTEEYARSGVSAPHSPLGHMGAGFAITAGLSWLRMQYAWWPLHPIGFIMLPTTPLHMMWFSIFLGWLCKVLIVRFGGARLYQQARPFFIGLILAEAVIAAIWMAVGISLSAAGLEYRAIRIMPE